MALVRGKKAEIPADAVILSREEAVLYQVKILNSWKKPQDVLAFKYGGAFLASMSAFAGLYINSYYRRKFRLMSYGSVSSYLPIVILPSALSFFFHTQMVLPGLVLQDTCAICLEFRASAIQSMIGSFLPSILAPVSALALATQYGTYNVPFITREPLKVLKLWRTQTKPVANVLFAIFIGQAVLGSAVTYLESKSVTTVNEKLAKLEYEPVIRASDTQSP